MGKMKIGMSNLQMKNYLFRGYIGAFDTYCLYNTLNISDI